MIESDTIASPPAVKSLLVTVGKQVKALRKEQGLTLAQLSEVTGLSPAIVSQIERGLANPSFSTLAQLAHGLNISVGRFFLGQGESKSPVVRKSERRNLTGIARESEGEETYELLTPNLSGALEVHWIVTPPGHNNAGSPFHHGGEEFGTIISGKKDVYLGGERFTLEAGDSITYSSEIPHWYDNPYDEVCVSIWVNTPPTW